MKDEREVAGLRCREVLALLYDYLDDQLESAKRSQVEAHLAGCALCADFGGKAGAVARAVRTELVKPDPIPGDLKTKLLMLSDPDVHE